MPSEEDYRGPFMPIPEVFRKADVQVDHGARRIQHPSPPRPELERLMKESAEQVANMTEEERRKMVADQVKNIMPYARKKSENYEPAGCVVVNTGEEIAKLQAQVEKLRQEAEEARVRNELVVGRVIPLTVGEGVKGLVSGGCVKRSPFDDPVFPSPFLDLLKLEQERKQNEERNRKNLEYLMERAKDLPMDDLSLFEKQLREARCPICGAREGCDHSKEERIREFARAGIRAQQKVEQGKEASQKLQEATEALRTEKEIFAKAEELLDTFLGCKGTPGKDTGPNEVKAKPTRILVVVSNDSQQFRLRTLTSESRFLIVRAIDALPLAEKFSAVIVACRDYVHALDVDLGRKHERDTLRTWLNGLRYATTSKDIRDVIYL